MLARMKRTGWYDYFDFAEVIDGQVNSVSSQAILKMNGFSWVHCYIQWLSVASFSNKSPTDDGRLKGGYFSDWVALIGCRRYRNNANVIVPSRRTTSGTSMSTPITAGGTALLTGFDGFLSDRYRLEMLINQKPFVSQRCCSMERKLTADSLPIRLAGACLVGKYSLFRWW